MANARNIRRIRLTKIRQEIAELEAKLRSVPVGVESVTVDGTTTRWNRKAAEDRLEFLLDKEGALMGNRRRIASIDLSGGF